MPGKLITHKIFPSEYVPARHLEVWLPPGYQASEVRYPVIYMHDGQNLFRDDYALSGVGWGIDEAMDKGITVGKLPAAIIVGIWNTDNRFGEYMPQKPITLNPESEAKFKAWLGDYEPSEEEFLCSDDYLKFVVKELKPFIDSTYRTLPDRPNTHSMGSSMGALISVYALCEYPDVFGGAGCVSIHWPVGDGIMFPYLEQALPQPGNHKIYYDFGTLGHDADYESYQLKIDALMEERGYTQDKDWITRKFEGHDHSEKDWRKRVHIPLEFFLG
jgi:predicted alpha/beta superfamily hydrolase